MIAFMLENEALQLELNRETGALVGLAALPVRHPPQPRRGPGPYRGSGDVVP